MLVEFILVAVAVYEVFAPVLVHLVDVILFALLLVLVKMLVKQDLLLWRNFFA